jgi:hypothetical protein
MYNAPPCLGEYYWGRIFSLLSAWQETIRARLEAIDWIVDSKTVSIILKWNGPFRSIELVNFEGVADIFWFVSFQIGQPTYLSVASTALLLNIQLLSQWGANKLTQVEVDHNQLTVMLKLPRADISSSPPSPLFLSENVIDQILNYIITQMITRYIEASKHLETILLGEVNRLEPFLMKSKLEESWFNELQGVSYSLASIREDFIANW